MQIKLHKYAEFECLGNNLYKHCDFLSFLKPTGCLFLLVNGSSGYLKFGAWGFSFVLKNTVSQISSQHEFNTTCALTSKFCCQISSQGPLLHWWCRPDSLWTAANRIASKPADQTCTFLKPLCNTFTKCCKCCINMLFLYYVKIKDS